MGILNILTRWVSSYLVNGLEIRSGMCNSCGKTGKGVLDLKTPGLVSLKCRVCDPQTYEAVLRIKGENV